MDEIQFDESRFDWGGVYFGLGAGHARFSTFDPTAVPSPANASPAGGIVTAFAGFNTQRGNIVAGVEADASVGNVSDSNAPFGFMTPIDMEYLATIRARLGIADDTYHAFVTAGVAFASFEITGGLGFATLSEQFTGFTAGAGIERKLQDDWFARLEYAYFDLGTGTLDFGTIAVPDIRQYSIDDGHVIRISIAKKM